MGQCSKGYYSQLTNKHPCIPSRESTQHQQFHGFSKKIEQHSECLLFILPCVASGSAANSTRDRNYYRTTLRPRHGWMEHFCGTLSTRPRPQRRLVVGSPATVVLDNTPVGSQVQCAIGRRRNSRQEYTLDYSYIEDCGCYYCANGDEASGYGGGGGGSDDEDGMGGIAGAIVGAMVGLAILVGMPMIAIWCCCCPCQMEARKGQKRS